MKNLHKQWVFIAKFDLLDLDPDPFIENGSGSRRRFEYGSIRIRIRNTDLEVQDKDAKLDPAPFQRISNLCKVYLRYLPVPIEQWKYKLM